MNVKVNILNNNITIPPGIIKAAGGDELIARIFFNRGYTDPQVVSQMLDESTYIPVTPSDFSDMDKVVERIAKAIEGRETIAVYGDYDVDGVTSTASLMQCLAMLGSKAIYHVPDRFTEGYGMNSDVIRTFPDRGVSLIITCDCGISNHNEISIARSLGMDVIVTDHHSLPDTLPEAYAILNPKLLPEGHRARNLSGCGMVYFLILALLKRFNREEQADLFLDLLAMSLIADVVSLNGENRYLLKKSLPALFDTQRAGLRKLCDIINKDYRLKTTEDVAFQIAPRINAAGRMESARLPVQLCLTDDAEEAEKIAQRIDELNGERKRLQQEIIEQAEVLAEEKRNKTVLVLFNEYWHHGIIGIAAGKLCETFRKPVILLSLKEDGKTVVGSARSVRGINIYELLKVCSSRLLKFGGHELAAGLSLSIDELAQFTREIEAAAEEKYFIRDSVQVDVDCEMGLELVNESLYYRLEAAGPYGEGFEAPVFLTRGLKVLSDRKTVRNHHIMVLAGENNSRIPAVKWSGEDENLEGRVFDVVYNIGMNTYRNNSRLQLTVNYLIEAGSNNSSVFEGQLIDGRSENIELLLGKYESAVVFYEGLASRCPVGDTINRYEGTKAKNLILLSLPVNSNVFREITALANPDRLIINFSILPDYSFKGFLSNLTGVLKHVIKAMDGRVSLEYLSIRLCVEESLIIAAVKYLDALGLLDYSINPDDRCLYISMASKPQKRTVHSLEKSLRNALMEKNAYKEFVQKLEIEQFREYLK